MKPCKRCKERTGYDSLGWLCRWCYTEVRAASVSKDKDFSKIIKITNEWFLRQESKKLENEILGEAEDALDVEWLIKEGWKE